MILALTFVASLASELKLHAAEPTVRGGRVGWARLISDDPEWERHTRSDNALSNYIKDRTSLNLDPSWHIADPFKPTDLTQYPFIFSTGLATLRDKTRQTNLAEYLNRGGFFLVDACINRNVTPDPDAFLADNTAVFKAISPGSTVRPLAVDHEIYGCFFNLKNKPPHTFHDGVFDQRWARLPLHGVFNSSGRLISVISLSGLQCGWDRMVAPEGHTEQCMQMVVNVYVFAMTQP